MRNARKLSLFMAIVVGAWPNPSCDGDILRSFSVARSERYARARRPFLAAMPGDEIKAESTPVTVTFADGSAIILAPGSPPRLICRVRLPFFNY